MYELVLPNVTFVKHFLANWALFSLRNVLDLRLLCSRQFVSVLALLMSVQLVDRLERLATTWFLAGLPNVSVNFLGLP